VGIPSPNFKNHQTKGATNDGIDSLTVTKTIKKMMKSLKYNYQEAQLSQRNRAMLHVIDNFAKSLKVI